MLADATGAMPPTLVIEADQRFLSEGLDCASVLVHGRNSHENQPRSPQRRRLILLRHEIVCLVGVNLRAQQGHRGRARASATISR